MALRKWMILGAGLLAAMLGALGLIRVAHAGPTVTVTVSLSQSYARVGGTADVIATATVRNSGVLLQTGQQVFFATSGDATFVGSTTVLTDIGGQATIHLTPGTKLVPQAISALSGGATGSATLTQYGAAAAVKLALGSPTVTADGVSTVTATVNVTDSSANGVPADSVTLGTSGDVKISAPVDQGNGTYTATVTASTTADTETLTATDGLLTGTATLTEKAGAATKVALALGVGSLTADGAATTTATATVTDVHLNGVSGETVTLRSSGDVAIGPVTDNRDGTYSATVTASKTADTETITATDGVLTRTAVLTETPGKAAKVALALGAPSLTANGSATTTATATVTDTNGNQISGETVTLETSGDVAIGAVTDNKNGTYSATVTASKTADTETITATDGALTGTATLTENPGAATRAVLALGVASLTADGAATTTATATVTDVNLNRVSGETVTLKTSGDVAIGAVTDNHNGTYTATVTASRTADTETLTATDGALTSAVTLTENPGAASSLTLVLNPGALPTYTTPAATSTATITLIDAFGNGISGRVPSLSTTGDVTFGAVTDNANGTYTTTVTASITPGPETITAAAAGLTSAPQTLGEYGATWTVTPAVKPGLIATSSTAVASVVVNDTAGNPVPNLTVAFASGGPTFPNGASATTDATGTASVKLLGDATAGQKTVTMAVNGKTYATTFTEFGPASAVALGLDPTQITADGRMTSTATITVTDSGGRGVTGEGITLSRSDTYAAAIGLVKDNGDGSYTATVTASARAQVETITASDPNVSRAATASLTEVAGPATRVSVGITPDATVVADGSTTRTVTATVTDITGNGVKGQIVSLKTSGDVTLGAVTDNRDGTYSATVTASRTADVETITATDGALTGTATLTENPGAAVTVLVTPHSHTLNANGTSHTTVTVLVTDANGNPVSGDTVRLSSSPGGSVSFGAVTYTGGSTTGADGLATSVMTASTHSGTVTVTATELGGNKIGTATEKLKGSSFKVATLSRSTVPADGRSTSTAQVMVVDGSGNPVSGETVNFSSGGDATVTPSAVTDGNGNASATVTSSKTTGTQTITARDSNSDPNADPADTFASPLTLTQVAPGTNASYIHAVWQAMLGHDVDQPSLSSWLAALDSGTPRTTLARYLATSTEYRTLVISGTNGAGALNFYQQYLGRASDPQGVAYWVNQMAQGMTFEQVRLHFIGSPEYFTHHNSSPSETIDALYNDVLARPSDAAGKGYWMSHFNVNTIAAQFLFSPEGRAHLVVGYYSTILNRGFDQPGLDYWTNAILHGASDEDVITNFLSSQEFYQSH